MFSWFSGKFKNTFRISLNVRSMSASASSSSPSPVLPDKQLQQVENVLSGTEDEHGGVIVEMSKEPMDPVIFTSLLKASMLHWKQQVIPSFTSCYLLLFLYINVLVDPCFLS